MGDGQEAAAPGRADAVRLLRGSEGEGFGERVKQPEVVNAYLVGRRIRALRRDESGELRESWFPAEWSFFTRAEDLPKYERTLRSSSAIRFIRREGDHVRVGCADYEVRDKLCREGPNGFGWFEERGIEVFEADISPVRRWLIDSGAVVQHPLFGFLDLETDPRVGFDRVGQGRVLCWGFVRRTGDQLDRVGGLLEEDTDAAERELLLELRDELADVDQVLCWNGDEFDFVVLRERIKRLGLRDEFDMRRWLWLDHLALYRKLNLTAAESGDEKASMALNRVADSLGVGRELAKVEAGKLSWDAWVAGGERRGRLLLDCVEDAATEERIEQETLFVETAAAVAEACGVLPDSYGMRGVAFVESLLLRLGAERGYRAPTKYGQARQDEKREKFRGAFVFPTDRGLHRDVHICDFSRLYPSIMQAFNMSPDTHRGPARERDLAAACRARAPGEAVAPVTLQKFRTDKRGLFPAALDILVERRKHWSRLAKTLPMGSPERRRAERLDAGYKNIVNTFYGVAGSVFSRYFKVEVSESVTQVGVWLIQNTCASLDPERDWGSELWRAKEPVRCPLFEGRPLRTVAGDTDSSFIKGCSEQEFVGFVEWCNGSLYPALVGPTGADPSFISLAFEKSFALMVNVEKKTYAGRVAHKNLMRAADDAKPSIKGLEYKRGDTAKLARDFQKEVLDEVLMVGLPLGERYPVTPADLERRVERWKRAILTADFDFGEAVVAKSMNKSFEEYGAPQPDGRPSPIPAHVRVAKILADRGEVIYPGAKIEYVVVDGASSPMRVKPAMDATAADLDLFYLWERLVWPAAERVLGVCWPEHGWSRWGSVRPLRTTLPGQLGFGVGERAAPPPKPPPGGDPRPPEPSSTAPATEHRAGRRSRH